jgi:folate-dependent phosphoribosylglycinamide formyltransferase PurN
MTAADRPRIGILASGSGSTFEAVFESIQEHGLPDADIAFVICNNGPDNPKAGIWERCQRLSVPIYHISNATQPTCTIPEIDGEPVSGTVSYEASDRMCELAEEYDIPLYLALGFMRKLIGSVLHKVPIANEHSAPLPATAGKRLIEAQEKVMRDGLSHSGPTMHWMGRDLDEHGLPIYDNGPIIGHEPVEITDEMRKEWEEKQTVSLLTAAVRSTERRKVPEWTQDALQQVA